MNRPRIALASFLIATCTLAATQSTSESGQSAQVRTGTSSGLDTDARLLNLLADHQFSRIASQIDQLPVSEAQFYRGILANRDNDPQKSIQFLEPLLDQVTASGNTEHEKLLRKALAEDYLRVGNIAKAAAAYRALESRLGSKLTPDEQEQIELPLKLLPLAKDNPAMTADPCDPFSLQVSTDPLGLIDIPVFVDARPHTWMLDPTAPFNLIALSTAEEVGLKLSAESATVHTLTGRPMQVHATVIPRFTIGGRLTLRNVTVFVYNDADYSFPQSHYSVEGVLGYPALAALGSLTVTSDDTIQVRPASQADPPSAHDKLTTGARFYLDGDQIVVALGNTHAPNDERMYAIDEGSQQTYLTSRYYDEHTASFASLKPQLYTPPAEPNSVQPSYVAETVPFDIGDERVELHYLRVLTQPLGNAALDDVYGILGIDALQQLKSYTFDYRTMRFSVRSEE
ncbi:MAG TPA: retropepsin-like aspartic protease [Terracidiphilus sp.]|nr:retropepsin-like aspartic protease [Terracidiphilus sp.]